MEKLDEGLKTLLDLGKRRGFLTFDQVNDYLPDEASSPEKIHGLLESLDELGIELINEDEAEARLVASGDVDDEPEDLADEPAEEDDSELTPEDLDEISRRIDDPVRMYLTQMGEIPLLTREQEIAPGQEDRGHPQAVPPQGARVRLTRCSTWSTSSSKVNAGELPFDRTVKVSRHREPREGPDPRPDAAQPGDARPPDGAEHRGLPQPIVRAKGDKDGPPRPPPEPQGPPPQGGHAGRGAVDPHPEGPAADEEAGADLGPDGRAASSRSRTTARGRGVKEERANLEKELQDLMLMTLETPSQLRQARRGHELAVRRVRAGQARALRRQPAAGRLDRQEVPQPRPVASST